MGTLVKSLGGLRPFRMKETRPFTVVVEGNIGCGKTTFLDHFSKFSDRVEVLTEPVDRWRDVNGHNLLQLMYENPSGWALPFQSYVQLTMLENHVLNTGKPVKLIERSIFSARYCFVENMYRTEKMLGCEYEVLDEWFKFATKDSALDLKVDLIIYLKTTPEKALERINIRARSEENQIPLEYLKQLHKEHEGTVFGASNTTSDLQEDLDTKTAQPAQLPGAFKTAILASSSLASAPAAV